MPATRQRHGGGAARRFDQYLDLIAEMGQDFAASRDIGHTVRRGLVRIAEAVEAEAASVFLSDDETGEIVCHACAGPVDISGLRLPAGTGIVGKTIAEGRARLVRDVRRNPDFQEAVDARTGFVTRSILCAPMTAAGRCLGAIEVVNKRAGRLFGAADSRLLEALGASAALAVSHARLTAAMIKQEAVRRELELAAEIQRGMLPPNLDDVPLWGINLPARAVSGDFFDILPLGGGKFAFSIGDVSGKGINAALLMAKTSSLFRCLAKTMESPGRLLAAVNAELCETGMMGMFVTMAAGVFDQASGTVLLASAGHEPAVVHRAGAGGFEVLPPHAPPLGIAADLIGPAVPEDRLALGDGCLYLFTDGLTECALGDGGMLGSDGVRDLIERYADLQPAQRVAALAARVSRPDAAVRDDLTLLLVGHRAR